MNKNPIGVFGLGVMGASIALNLANHGFSISVYNKNTAKTKKLMERITTQKVSATETLPAFVQSLEKPRKILLMITAGKGIDDVIENLIPYLEKGDILIDGGNSYFKDTIRRYHYLKEKGISFIGMGISGGEMGALLGPSMMPSGDLEAYQQVVPIFEKIAAKANDGKSCIAYIGDNGSGHYVKMVHNGIEYADIQIISEAYEIMRHVAKMSVDEIRQVFETWNQGRLQSYLIEITAEILKKKDEATDQYLIDVILDRAEQKGTGKWTSIEGLEIGAAIPSIAQSVFARMISSQKEERSKIATYFQEKPVIEIKDQKQFIDDLEKSVYAAKIAAYAQGFDLMKKASEQYHWHLNFSEIAMIWREGCIIRAQFLDEIRLAYETDVLNLMCSEQFVLDIKEALPSWRRIVTMIVEAGIYAPGMMSALSYFDGIRSEKTSANLIQAQRDYFGAHTYERIDQEGNFHTIW